jgi:hypothetical protein
MQDNIRAWRARYRDGVARLSEPVPLRAGKTMERGEKLEILDEKAENLSVSCRSSRVQCALLACPKLSPLPRPARAANADLAAQLPFPCSQNAANKFNKQATSLKNEMRWRYIRLFILAFVIVAVRRSALRPRLGAHVHSCCPRQVIIVLGLWVGGVFG